MLMTVLLLLAVQDESLLERLEREISGVVRRVRPSVVSVEAKRSEMIRLSGIVYRADGCILTDAGAIAGADSIRVTLFDGRSFEGRPVGSDFKTGIAVLRIDAKSLTPAEFGTTRELRSGAFAVSVGNAHGLEGSASVGTLAGLDRSIRVSGRRYDGMIQLTTVAHPGDCGALVADSRGRVIGLIHSALGSEEAEGELFRLWKDFFGRPLGGAITFAVPAETVQFVADRILKHGRMIRGWIGMSVRTAESGVEILKLEIGGPARRAGLRRGDRIVAWDGESVGDAAALQKKVEACEEPRIVKAAVVRDGVRIDVDLRVEIEPERK